MCVGIRIYIRCENKVFVLFFSLMYTQGFSSSSSSPPSSYDEFKRVYTKEMYITFKRKVLTRMKTDVRMLLEAGGKTDFTGDVRSLIEYVIPRTRVVYLKWEPRNKKIVFHRIHFLDYLEDEYVGEDVPSLKGVKMYVRTFLRHLGLLVWEKGGFLTLVQEEASTLGIGDDMFLGYVEKALRLDMKKPLGYDDFMLSVLGLRGETPPSPLLIPLLNNPLFPILVKLLVVDMPTLGDDALFFLTNTKMTELISSLEKEVWDKEGEEGIKAWERAFLLLHEGRGTNTRSAFPHDVSHLWILEKEEEKKKKKGKKKEEDVHSVDSDFLQEDLDVLDAPKEEEIHSVGDVESLESLHSVESLDPYMKQDVFSSSSSSSKKLKGENVVDLTGD